MPTFQTLLCLTILLACHLGQDPGCAAQPTTAAPWAADRSYRIAVSVDPGDQPRVNAPVGVKIDFQNVLRQRLKVSGRVDRGSICVVQIDPVSGRPIPGQGQQIVIPHQTTGDFPNDDAGWIWWRMKDRRATRFHVYFNTRAGNKQTLGPAPGLIGVGDMFHYRDGRPGFANAVALHSQYWHLDWDGDGLRDLIGFGYGQYEFGDGRPDPDDREENWWRKLALGNAVYFFKNVGSPGRPLFAARYRLKGADGQYLKSALRPQNMFPADWDADGDPDFFGTGRSNDLLLWVNTGRRDHNNLWILEQAVKIDRLDELSDFRKNYPRLVERPPRFSFRGVRRVDWDADGDWDLIACLQKTNQLWKVDPRQGVIPYGANLEIFELFENVAEPANGRATPKYARPVVIREERGLPINAFSVATGCVEYVDWDNDGDHDLLYHDRTTRPLQIGRLMFSENRGTREKPLLSLPIPILKVTDSPFVVDWNDDGLLDVIAGSEFFENVNPRSRKPQPAGRRVASRTASGTRRPHAATFPRLESRGFAQQVHPLMISYFGVSVDWDHDGVLDMVRGHHNHVLLFRNRGTLLDPVFDRGVQLQAGGRPIHMPNWLDPSGVEPSHFGPQGPSEPLHGWLNPTIGDWDSDGDLDLFVTGQRWQTMYFENVGSRDQPRLATGREVRCDGDRFEFSWRSKVSVGDIDGDGRPELVVTSSKDRVFYAYRPARKPGPQQADAQTPRTLELTRGDPLVLENGTAIQGWYGGQNNNGDNHSLLVDWDGDGDLDLINGSLFAVWYYENSGGPQAPRFRDGVRFRAGGVGLHTFDHAGSIDAADWNGDGRLDLVLSTECPSDQPHGAGLHLFDRSLLENDLPSSKLGAAQKRPAPR